MVTMGGDLQPGRLADQLLAGHRLQEKEGLQSKRDSQPEINP